jgi:hypothetical protein
MNTYSAYVYLIFFVKLIFIAMAFVSVTLGRKTSMTATEASIVRFAEHWKERFEFIFKFLMALLLFYLFFPHRSHHVSIDRETNLLLYLLGFILIVTADWNTFFHEAPWFKTFQRTI